jgi:hypothetical protein
LDLDFFFVFNFGLDIFISAGMDFGTSTLGARFTLPKMGDGSKVACGGCPLPGRPAAAAPPL